MRGPVSGGAREVPKTRRSLYLDIEPFSVPQSMGSAPVERRESEELSAVSLGDSSHTRTDTFTSIAAACPDNFPRLAAHARTSY